MNNKEQEKFSNTSYNRLRPWEISHKSSIEGLQTDCTHSTTKATFHNWHHDPHVYSQHGLVLRYCDWFGMTGYTRCQSKRSQVLLLGAGRLAASPLVTAVPLGWEPFWMLDPLGPPGESLGSHGQVEVQAWSRKPKGGPLQPPALAFELLWGSLRSPLLPGFQARLQLSEPSWLRLSFR